MKLFKSQKLIAAVVATLLSVAGISAHAATITAVGAGMGGGWTIGLGAIGKIVSANIPNIEYKLVPGASMANPPRLANKEGDFSITNHSMASASLAGTAPYKNKISGVSSILNIGDTTLFHIVVPEDSPITKISDIKDKKFPLRVSHGPMGSIVELSTRWVLEEYGISYKDIRDWGGKNHPLSFNDAVSLFKDGQLDMFCWFGAGESPYLQEIVAGKKVRWISIPDDKIESIAKKHGLKKAVIPSTFLNGAVKTDTPCIGDGSELIVRSELDQDFVYQLTKLIITNRDEIALAIPAWKSISSETATQNLGLPLHPGAVKYYREIGVMK